MKFTKRLRMRGLYLVGLCLLSVFAFGAAGSASAAPLLFVPHSGKFPYHFAGGSGLSKLVTVGGTVVESAKSDVLLLALNSTLFNVHINFLEAKSAGSNCGNPTAASKQILINLEGHLGLADPGDVPASLLLVPGHFTFKCIILGFEVPVLVKGHIIGRITSPALNTASELLLISYKQTSGVQEFTTFLLGNETLTNQFEQSSTGGGAFEQSGQEGHATLHALPGQGTFLLVSP